MRRVAVLFAVLCVASSVCAQTRRRAAYPAPKLPPAQPLSIAFDFDNGDSGWQAGFADFSPQNADMELQSGIMPLPSELEAGNGFMLHGNNHSDDLFMFLKRKLTPADGIQPNRSYVVDYEIRLISPAPTGCGGIGGAPGESVYLKAGATTAEPLVLLVDSRYRMNVDIGSQSQGGTGASVISTIANGLRCSGYPIWAPLVRSHTHPFAARANPDGTLWLLVGTDSGFEGITTVYYTDIAVTLTPVP